jgi:hypothetical protein
MTDEMLDFARAQAPVVAANLGYTQSNVEFRKGQADAIPVTDNSVDLIVSNCVINLAPDKPQVFGEMYRVLRPGGRFTISDIVADQSIPNYLLYDKEKWGDCLSGALQLGTYWKGIREAGFRGIHQVSFIPWKIIDGIHFLSLTLTGYKLPEEPMLSNCHYATFTGPFSRVVDEQGEGYHRGIPEKIDTGTATLLQSPPYRDLFVLSDDPVELSDMDPRLTSVAPEETPCLWEGHFALLTGPFLKVTDDDHHEFPCGEPLEVCSKTLKVLRSEPYNSHFVVINRSGEAVSSPETISADTCC